MADLATRLLALEQAAGFAPVPIQVIGLRPGEKRNEVLADPRLVFERTIDRRIRVARQSAAESANLGPMVARVRRAASRADDAAVLDLLASMPGGFVPSQLAVDHARRSQRPAADDGRKGHAA